MSALDTALRYIERGWAPVPIPYMTKRPTIGGWQRLRITGADAPRYFNSAPQNVGVLLGQPSGNLVDVDLDCPEALALADAFLPPTEAAFGREGKPRSHRLYTTVLPKRVEHTDPDDGEMLLELRSNGGQTVFPGSTHASGEAIEWTDDGEPASVDPGQLGAATGRLAAACILVRAAPATDRHNYLLDTSGALVRGLGRDGAANILAPVARLILGKLYSKADGARLLDDTARKLEAGEPVPGWPRLAERVGDKRTRKVAEWLGVNADGRNESPDDGGDPRERVDLNPARINHVTRRCAELLADTIYMRGRFPSAVVPAGDVNPDAILGGVRHDQSSLVMVAPTAGMIQFKLDEHLSFFKRDVRSKSSVQVSCPKDLAQRLIDAATDMPFRQCSGIVTVPLFLDGEIIATPGYHAPTGRVIAFDGPLPAIPERPVKADALAALDVLLRPFRGYLSGHKTKLHVGLAAASLTAIARPSLPTAPAMVLDANTPGAGKGKLARALAVLATGTLPSVITEGHAEEETEKRIASAILSGGPVLLLDNMQRTLASSALESALTEGVATIRVFGKIGEDITVSFSAMVIVTANNAALRADLLRRVLPIRILVDTDEPEKRPFDFDPYLEARRDRLQILAAGFTILRAWWNHRTKTRTLGSFEHWAELVAGAVEWLTGTNPISLIEERKAEDPGRAEERQVVNALHALFGTIEWTAKEAVGRPAPAYQPADNPTSATGLDPDIWRGVLDFKTERPSPKEVGKWLSRQKDKVFGDLRLACRLGSDKVGLWKVEGRVQGVQPGSNPPSPREMSKNTADGVVTVEDTEGQTNPVEPPEPGASWEGTL